MNTRGARLSVACPACNHRLGQREQRRMNTILGASRSIECPNCGQSVQWHHSLRTRMLLGGLMFRAGAFALIAFILCTFVFPLASTYNWVGWFAALVAIAGVLVTATPSSRTMVEAASK